MIVVLLIAQPPEGRRGVPEAAAVGQCAVCRDSLGTQPNVCIDKHILIHNKRP